MILISHNLHQNNIIHLYFNLLQGLVVKPIFIVISVSFKFLFRATSGAYPTEMQCAAVSICQALIMVPMEFCIKHDY